MANYLKTGRTEMASMGNVSYGLSKKGIQKYIDDLDFDVKAIKEAIKAVDGIQKAIDKGWQGYSRDVFYEDFNESIEDLLDSVEKESKDLKNRLEELQNNLINQDINMYYTN